jgi:hypothetical protein
LSAPIPIFLQCAVSGTRYASARIFCSKVQKRGPLSPCVNTTFPLCGSIFSELRVDLVERHSVAGNQPAQELNLDERHGRAGNDENAYSGNADLRLLERTVKEARSLSCLR